MRAISIFAFCGFGLFSTLGCKPGCNKSAEKSDYHEQEAPEKNETAAATINGVSISKNELDAFHKRAVDQFAKSKRPIDAQFQRQLRGSILRKMMDDEVLRQRAKTEGIKIDRLERVENFEKFKEKIGGQKRFNAYLEHQNLTEEQVKKSVESENLREKLIEKIGNNKEPTEEELKNFYMANQRLYTAKEMVHARHILLKFSKDEPKEKEDLVIKKAHQILQEAAIPNVSFESLVQKYSEGPSVKEGGDLGFFPRGRMVKAFDDAAFSAPIKKAVGPIKTDFGYHIIYVEEKSPPKISSYAEVKDRVVEAFTRNKKSRQTEELLSSLRQNVKVKINDAALTEDEYFGALGRAQMASQDSAKPKESP